MTAKRTSKAAKVKPMIIERCSIYDNCWVIRPPKGWKFTAVDMCGRWAHLQMEAE